MPLLKRLLRALPLLLLSPVLVVAQLRGAAADGPLWKAVGRAGSRHRAATARERLGSATIVIPNWNGKDLLAKYLPSVIEALAGHPDNEILVVDNGSTDGSAAFCGRVSRSQLLALARNLGFGGGSNAGFRAARNDIVVLLNNDMRVAPDSLAPLARRLPRTEVFAVPARSFSAIRTKFARRPG